MLSEDKIKPLKTRKLLSRGIIALIRNRALIRSEITEERIIKLILMFGKFENEVMRWEVRNQKVSQRLLKCPETILFRVSSIILPSTQNKAPNGSNFITLGKISEEEKIAIIKTGFRLNQEGKISLKKYYEGTEEYSLSQWKGYNIKYDTIRKTGLYSKLKEE
jgi:hypothetical protein